MSKQKLTVRISAADLASRPIMSEGEKAARIYLGNKQIERNLRIDRYVVLALATLAIVGLVAPFALIWGTM